MQYRYNAKYYKTPHLKTLRRLLEMERIYGKVLRKYSKNPSRWDRTPSAQGKHVFPLKPVRVAKPGDTPEMVFLDTYGRASNQFGTFGQVKFGGGSPTKRAKIKAGLIEASRKRSQTWARKFAQGWDWHEAREAIYAGRPYYNMGRKRAMEKGIPAESLIVGKKPTKFPNSIKK
ncbi:MAG: hypothetical protein ACREJN_08305 [Nitrospiraceae bacterium]